MASNVSTSISKRKVICQFGLLNIGGLMDSTPIYDGDLHVGFEISKPLFCHTTYKIKPTFNRNLNRNFALLKLDDDPNDGKYYQKKFRRNVEWDFGDGYKEEGYSVEHSYKMPGRYKISCTFYDINRCAWENLFYVEVVVKEVLPTQLNFVQDQTSSVIKCSKIERICRLQATLSTTTETDLQIRAKRIFTEEEEDNSFEEIGKRFNQLTDEIFKFTRKHWTFLENEQQLLYQSTKVYGEKLTPTEVFTPDYHVIYGKFYYDAFNENEPIKIALYQVIPYKSIDDNLKEIEILNPNVNINDILTHEGDGEDFKKKFIINQPIIQLYTDDQIPDGVEVVGKRAFVDVFYKNDFLTESENHKNVFSFYYDVDTTNITNELKSSKNYLNVIPLGLSVVVENNDLDKVRIGVSTDGFIRLLSDEDDWTKEKYYIDPYLKNSLVSGIDLDFYFFPYIEYNNVTEAIEGVDDLIVTDGDKADFILQKPMYYVPKDVDITTVIPQVDEIEGVGGRPSLWNNARGVEEIEPWLKRVSFSLFDYFNVKFTVVLKNLLTYTFSYTDTDIIKPDEIEIPHEKYVNENVDELVDVYMSHPMFDDTPLIKEMLSLVLKGNDFLNYTLTKSKHFLDDRANVRTCYLSSLIETLKMMGEEVLEYEDGYFEGVNDLRDFVRVLSINHNDLVGHLKKEDYDISYKSDFVGKNVGNEILSDDIITVKNGRIIKIQRGYLGDGKYQETYDFTSWDDNGVYLIIRDIYTNESKLVNFDLAGDGEKQLIDYRNKWGWNLLLPKRYGDSVYKLEKNEEYLKNNGINLFSRNELNRIKLSIKETIDGYYKFYALNPMTDERRIGNFLDERSLTDDILNPVKWDSDWGITHRILMKIFKENAYLHSSKVAMEDEESGELKLVDTNGYTGNVDEEIVNLSCVVYDKDDNIIPDVTFNGILTVDGYIYGGTVDEQLNVTIKGFALTQNGNRVELTPQTNRFRINLTIEEENTIKPSKQYFDVAFNGYQGQIVVNSCGKLVKDNDFVTGFVFDADVQLKQL